MSKIVGGLAISEWIARFVLALTRTGEAGKRSVFWCEIERQVVATAPGPQPLKVALSPAAPHIVGDMLPHLWWDRWHINQIELSIAA